MYVREGRTRVVAETADLLACVAVVVRVAAVRRAEAQVPALFHALHLLVHGVDGLEDAAVQLFELAQLDGLLDTVVLQVVIAGGHVERPSAGHRQPVHVRQLAFSTRVLVVGGPVNINNKRPKRFF